MTTTNLQEIYEKTLVPELKKSLGRTNVHTLPQVEKVTINVGVGSMITQGSKDTSVVEQNIATITGQKPNVRKSRLSISNFKLREGMPVGFATTLSGQRMFDFLERFVNVALPRVRDFRGISVKGFDGTGNFSIGLKDVTIFPEVNLESMERPHGLQVNVKTSAKSDYEAYLLLKGLGFPFKDEVKAPESK